MAKHAHGDPRRPDGDLVSGEAPIDRRVEPGPTEFGPKVGWGHDAVFRPPPPQPAEEVAAQEEAPPDDEGGVFSEGMTRQ